MTFLQTNLVLFRIFTSFLAHRQKSPGFEAVPILLGIPVEVLALCQDRTLAGPGAGRGEVLRSKGMIPELEMLETKSFLVG